MNNKTGIIERLEKGVVFSAEGYIFELERRGYVKAGPYVPEVILEYPEVVKELHREFMRAGSEVIVALTYYAHREKMRIVGRGIDTEELNRKAIRLAREIAEEGDAIVAGNLCNTWVYDPEERKETSDIVREIYEEQVKWAVNEGIDFVLGETFDYLGEALIALQVIKKFNLPAMITLFPVHEKTKEGYPYEEACKILEAEGAQIVGLNCARGPDTMLPVIEKIRKNVHCYVAAQPVPYRTTKEQPTFQSLKERGHGRAFPLGLDPFIHTRFEMADFAQNAQKLGVNYIGICCGAGPHHVRAMAEALGRKTVASKYSPDLKLHPMLGAKVKKRDAPFVKDWKD